MIIGVAAFDGLAVGELTATFMGPSLKLTAKAAFVASKTGHTHGWTSNEQWSPTTIEKLKELRAAMEQDLARVHFGEVDTAQASPGMAFPAPPPGGIGEHVTGDAPSI